VARRNGRRKNGASLPPPLSAAAAEAVHQRFLYLFDEYLGKMLRENPEVERRVAQLSADIFEMIAAGLRKQAEKGQK